MKMMFFCVKSSIFDILYLNMVICSKQNAVFLDKKTENEKYLYIGATFSLFAASKQ